MSLTSAIILGEASVKEHLTVESPNTIASGLSGWLSREGLDLDDVLIVHDMAALQTAVRDARDADPRSPIVVIRARPSARDAIRVGDIVLDQQRNLLRNGDHEWRLRPKQVAVLAALMRTPGRVVSRAALIAQVWSNPGAKHEATLRVYVQQLRRIIDAGLPRGQHIVTVRSTEGGGGYLFRADADRRPPPLSA